jgi:hypothetical protein
MWFPIGCAVARVIAEGRGLGKRQDKKDRCATAPRFARVKAKKKAER